VLLTAAIFISTGPVEDASALTATASAAQKPGEFASI
jgi:hypothetical protein